MNTPTSATLPRAALCLATGSAVAVLFSVAVYQILLGAALFTLVIARERFRLPPLGLPLSLFILGTLLSLALSPDPIAGTPQIRKLYIFTALPVLYTALTSVDHVRNLLLVQGILATASGLWSFVQFWQKRTEALSHGLNFYLHYVANRATGFMSHWMTFSAEQMIVGLMLASLLMFGAIRRLRAPWLAALGVIAGSVMIVQTRSVWFGSAAAAVYLVAMWRPKLLLLTPVVAVVLWFASPSSVRERLISVYRPHGQHDSNEHRRILFRTGIEMIRSHPIFGLGPEMPKREFSKYVPADIPKPLPEGFYGHLHNVYLQYAAERGIPTLLAMLWLIGKAIADFIRAARRLAPDEQLRRAILHGAVASIIGILVEAFGEHNLGDSEILMMFLTVIATGYIAAMKDPARA